MDFVITYTSQSHAPSIKHFNSLEELINFYNKVGSLILQHNTLKNEDPNFIMEWNCVSNIELATQICECDYELEVYDDYRE